MHLKALLLIIVRIANGAEWSKSECGKFKVLLGEWNADNSYRHKKSKNNVNNGYIETAKKDPDYIKKEVDTSISRSFKIKSLSKRRQGKNSQFYQLNAKGDANDG
jgi:hypothetical protein